MRRAVFGEPLRAHPPEIGWTNAPGNTQPGEHQRHTGYDENSACEQHGLEAAGTRPVMASIIPDRAALVCAVMHIRTDAEARRR